ncbi:hypothetical protein BKA62DRAFT_773237 [Auriculariales sp. MPI-PUGE-AT-0066]|nr:hypothetical protein BKA62DRAFT_773237 [Auriculariales sp. MPI-PUGE-AT-0066]
MPSLLQRLGFGGTIATATAQAVNRILDTLHLRGFRAPHTQNDIAERPAERRQDRRQRPRRPSKSPPWRLIQRAKSSEVLRATNELESHRRLRISASHEQLTSRSNPHDSWPHIDNHPYASPQLTASIDTSVSLGEIFGFRMPDVPCDVSDGYLPMLHALESPPESPEPRTPRTDSILLCDDEVMIFSPRVRFSSMHSPDGSAKSVRNSQRKSMTSANSERGILKRRAEGSKFDLAAPHVEVMAVVPVSAHTRHQSLDGVGARLPTLHEFRLRRSKTCPQPLADTSASFAHTTLTGKQARTYPLPPQKPIPAYPPPPLPLLPPQKLSATSAARFTEQATQQLFLSPPWLESPVPEATEPQDVFLSRGPERLLPAPPSSVLPARALAAAVDKLDDPFMALLLELEAIMPDPEKKARCDTVTAASISDSDRTVHARSGSPQVDFDFDLDLDAELSFSSIQSESTIRASRGRQQRGESVDWSGSCTVSPEESSGFKLQTSPQDSLRSSWSASTIRPESAQPTSRSNSSVNGRLDSTVAAASELLVGGHVVSYQREVLEDAFWLMDER